MVSLIMPNFPWSFFAFCPTTLRRNNLQSGLLSSFKTKQKWFPKWIGKLCYTHFPYMDWVVRLWMAQWVSPSSRSLYWSKTLCFLSDFPHASCLFFSSLTSRNILILTNYLLVYPFIYNAVFLCVCCYISVRYFYLLHVKKGFKYHL